MGSMAGRDIRPCEIRTSLMRSTAGISPRAGLESSPDASSSRDDHGVPRRRPNIVLVCTRFV